MRRRVWMQTAAVSHPPRRRKQFITTFRIMILIICCLAFNVSTISNPSVSIRTTTCHPFPGFFFLVFRGGGGGGGGGEIFRGTKKIWKIKIGPLFWGSSDPGLFFQFSDIKKMGLFFQKCRKFY
jgi:hypothetical protein